MLESATETQEGMRRSTTTTTPASMLLILQISSAFFTSTALQTHELVAIRLHFILLGRDEVETPLVVDLRQYKNRKTIISLRYVKCIPYTRVSILRSRLLHSRPQHYPLLLRLTICTRYKLLPYF